jgi:glycosyltransferase involved in cell wall biosynthesis
MSKLYTNPLHFIILNNGIGDNGMSGSDRRALNWSRIFKEKGNFITLYIPESGIKRYENDKYNVIITSKLSVKKNNIFIVYIWRAIKACVLAPKYINNAIIYSSSDLIADSIPAIYMKHRLKGAMWISGLHLIATNPFTDFQRERKNLPSISKIYYFLSQRVILKFMKRYASLVLVSNSLDRDFLIKNGFKEKQVLVTYGAVDIHGVPKIKTTIKYDACFVGRFHAQKGLLDMIEIWEHVCKHKPNAKLAIIGEGNMMAELVSRIKKKGLSENIVFLGFLDKYPKFEAIKSSSVFVFPSTYESFGMVALEAMACGLPVVAYELPIFKEIYTKGMLRVPIGDVASFADVLLDLLQDKEKREKLGRDAFELASRYTWDKTANDILRCIRIKMHQIK